MSHSKRIEWIDIAKGIGIILVVLGHCLRDDMRINSSFIDFLYQLIYSFHMGLFFSISGYLYGSKRKQNSKNYLRMQLKKLIIPWLVYSAIIYIIVMFVNFIPQISNMLKGSSLELIELKDYFIDMFAANNPYSFHLWYIYVLFIVELLYFCYNFLFKNKYKNIILILICGLLSYKITNSFSNLLLFNMIYYIIGVIYSKIKRNIKPYVIIFGVIYNSVFIIFYDYIQQFDILFIILKYIKILLSTPIIFLSILEISKIIKENKMLEYLGKNSYNVYLIHQPFCCGFLGLILTSVLDMNYISYIMIILICMVASFILPLILVYIVNKLKFKNVIVKLLNIKYYEYNEENT